MISKKLVVGHALWRSTEKTVKDMSLILFASFNPLDFSTDEFEFRVFIKERVASECQKLWMPLDTTIF